MTPSQPARADLHCHSTASAVSVFISDDDHAGIDIGRTWTRTPSAATPAEFLAHVRAGRVSAHGDQGSAAKWTHAALAIAVRSLGFGSGAAPDPLAVLRIVERVMAEGDARSGSTGNDLGPDDARALLRAWIAALDLPLRESELIARVQSDDFSHGDLQRRASRCHERGLRAAVESVLAAGGRADWGAAASEVFAACVAAVPYAPATAFLSRERTRLNSREDGRKRVALVADGVGAGHGVTRTLEEIRERGVPGFDVDVVGTDPSVDRRLSSVAEADVPFFDDLTIGVPGLPAVVDALSEGRYDLVHVCSPGPAGVAALLTARLLGLPVVASYHTELAAYAELRSRDPRLGLGMEIALQVFYGRADVVLSPSQASDARLAELGVAAERVGRWDRGVDLERFNLGRRRAGFFGATDGRIHVLYAGRLTQEKGTDLLASAFLAARAREPRLHLVLAGGGPEEAALRTRLGGSATFLGWLGGDDLAAAYASSDLFLFCSQTDTFGQVVLEAQASSLPVVAVGAGGPAELIRDGRSGVLCPARAEALADALACLAGSRAARDRLAHGGLAAVRDRSWESSLGRLGQGWARALAGVAVPVGGRSAA